MRRRTLGRAAAALEAQAAEAGATAATVSDWMDDPAERQGPTS